uniref:Uncharacterized protein n=1 Tax=Falco tinnunculus TaxID=100819 RepID=A0A8C4XU05_FALTI
MQSLQRTLSQAPVPLGSGHQMQCEKESKAPPGKYQLECPQPSDARAAGRMGRERGCSSLLETSRRQFSFKPSTLKLTHPCTIPCYFLCRGTSWQ